MPLESTLVDGAPEEVGGERVRGAYYADARCSAPCRPYWHLFSRILVGGAYVDRGSGTSLDSQEAKDDTSWWPARPFTCRPGRTL